MKTALRLLLAPYRFSVDRLFRMGQVGGAHWFDSPSLYPGGNHLYLYKDNAGTTPVTAVGDTIGLSLDRAYGGARGVELSPNRGSPFTDTTGFAHGSVTTSVDAGELVITAIDGSADRAEVSLSGLVVGKSYEFIAEAYAAPGVTNALFQSWTWATIPTTAITAGVWKTYRFIVQATATSGLCRVYASVSSGAPGDVVRLRSFSIREIPGTHLIQATGTARPTLSARVNWLTATELLDTWTKTGTAPTVTDGYVIGGGDNVPCSRLVFTASGSSNRISKIASGYPTSSGVTVPGKVFVRMRGAVGGEQLRIWNGWPSVDQTVSLTTSWQEFTISDAGGNSSSGLYLYAVSGTPTIYVRGVDIRTADDAAKNIPAYQRVGATAADHDTDGFPHGQYPDGTDDNQTTTTGGGGTTGFFYCGAITVSGGAGTARTIWSDTGTNTGYRVRINSSNKLELAAGNGTAYTTVQSNETITAPGTYILSAWDDGGVLAVQVNNFAAATTTRPTVSAGTSTVTMYKDNGAASSYLNGRDYGSVYRQSYIGESQHARLKRWLADRARITL